MYITGMVFDIQRTSLHDGPGIRTAVFLKGCPLRCVWCHNPESQSTKPEISFRVETCSVCGECVNTCHYGAHRIEKGNHIYDRSLCKPCSEASQDKPCSEASQETFCGDCVETCLYEALKIAGTERTVDDVMSVVVRDRLFYKQSGGGLTITGGEPMLQPEFSLELLKAAKSAGIHTCLDTSGWASQKRFAEVMSYVDLFLYDYKATDPETHKKLTGVSNALILSNLDYLIKQGARVRLRCPLVAGVNDSDDHFQGIANLHMRYPDLDGIDLMAYHNIGNAKYERFGLVNPLPNLPITEEPVKQAWLEKLQALGCQTADIG
jgi:glycyl-radical enzyme activating protein